MVKGASKDSNQDSVSGIDRLLFFILIFFLLTHIVACLWIMIPQFYKYDEDQQQFIGTWLEQYSEEMNAKQLYVLAIYWTIQTITTVGYGDLTITNTLEVIFCSIIMVAGVISFSFANGSLTSILSSYDS